MTEAENLPSVAFCGKPNVGKSALVNALAGSRLRVGNWPGVTVEKYEATVDWGGKPMHLVDLPGTQDFSCESEDQRIAIDFLFEKTSLCVNVVEATNLKHDLFLTLRLKELGIPMVVALNFADEVERLGWELDPAALEAELGCPVHLVSARKKTGLEELRRSITKGIEKQRTQHPEGFGKTRDWSQQVASGQLDPLLLESPQLLTIPVFSSLKGDWYQDFYLREQAFAEKHQKKFFEVRFDELNREVKRIGSACLLNIQEKRTSRSEKVDKWLLHPILGPVIGIVSILVVFSLAFSFSDPLIGFVDQFFTSFLYGQIGKITVYAPDWLNSFILDGIIAGLGLVLSFTPLMFVLYLLIGLLEESGYMMRIAFMCDRMMSSMGVSGRSIMPLFMGFGCNVPSVYATRALESEGEKRVTGFLVGFMSCGARLPVLGLFTAAFLGAWAGLAVVALYLLGVVVAILVSLVLKSFGYFRGSHAGSIFEVAPYRFPLFSNLFKSVFFRTGSYVKRASTRIVALLICLWVFTYFPAHGDMEKSYVASIARKIQPVFEPLGFGDRWELLGAMPTAIIAKEAALGALGQFLVHADDAEEEEAVPGFWEALQEQGQFLWTTFSDAFQFDILGFVFSGSEESVEADFGGGVVKGVRNLWVGDPEGPLKALSFAIFILLVVPCIVTLGALRQEFGTKYTVWVVGTYIVVPYLASLLFFQISSLLV